MKKTLLFLSLIIGLMSAATAQVCTPDSSNFTSGVIVYPASLPCIHQGSSYSGTVNIRIPDSVDAQIFFSGLPANTYFLYVDSIRLDSLTGAPAGISTATNPGSGVWLHPGQFGCVQISGTTTAAVGNFPLSIYGAGCVHGSVGGFPVDSCQSGLLPPFVNYSLDVCAPVVNPGVCTPDSAAFTSGTFFYPASLPCISQGIAYSQTVSIRIPDSIDAHTFVAQVPANSYFLHIDSMRIDSIVGVPAGMHVATNPGDSVWLHGGQFGCAQISGTTTDSVGNYPLNVYGRGCIHGTVFTFVIDTCVNGSLAAYFNYSLNVCNGTGACNVDTTHFSPIDHVYPTVLPCITTGTAYSGQINIQVPTTIDAHDFNSIIPGGQIVITIDSININSITGFPAGITSISNPVLTTWLQPLSYACAHVSGTVNAAVTPAGDYPLTISGIGCGHGQFPLIGAVDTCMNVSFTQVYPYKLSVCYPAGVAEISEGVALNIYPNPNQGTFTVSVSSADHIGGQLTIVDQLGRTIHAQDMDITGTKQISVDLGRVSPGIYVLMMNTANGRTVRSFSVK
jgi:hypothetical protein